jgi:thiosulfate/3-mercaptopyruvate sulfurtransferase
MNFSIREKPIFNSIGCSRILRYLVLSLFFVLPTAATAISPAASSELAYVDALPGGSIRVVDVRPKNRCERATIKAAVCFPVEQLFADNDRIANFSGLLWMLGTAGLSGDETVLVVGDQMIRKEAFAGLLFAAGQATVLVHSGNLTQISKSDNLTLPVGAGIQRSTTRTKVFTAIPRTHTLLTMPELQQELALDSAAPLFDTRTESEYWGRSIRAARGGHIPGAIWATSVESALQLESRKAIVYGHNALDGLAQLAKWTALGVQARVYLAGWSEWAADTRQAVDAETFRSVPLKSQIRTSLASSQASNQNVESQSNLGLLKLKIPVWSLLVVISLGLAVIVYQQRKTHS